MMIDNRHQVNKLVRVRRLLDRLELLSELPERLTSMIFHDFDKETVILYKKTITVFMFYPSRRYR